MSLAPFNGAPSAACEADDADGWNVFVSRHQNTSRYIYHVKRVTPNLRSELSKQPEHKAAGRSPMKLRRLLCTLLLLLASHTTGVMAESKKNVRAPPPSTREEDARTQMPQLPAACANAACASVVLRGVLRRRAGRQKRIEARTGEVDPEKAMKRMKSVRAHVARHEPSLAAIPQQYMRIDEG